MKLRADMKSPFTGNESVFVEYIPESSDYMSLDIDTGYVTMDKLFNREIWEEHYSDLEIRSYIDEIYESIDPELRSFTRWVDSQLWVLIQMGYEDISLKPSVVDGEIKWIVETKNEGTTYDKFEAAYDAFNYLCNIANTEEE